MNKITFFSFVVLFLCLFYQSCSNLKSIHNSKRSKQLSLTNPWSKTKKDHSEIYIYTSKSHFHFKFTVKDSNIIARKSEINFNGIGTSDRVELFLACDMQLKKYYGMEIDPEGRIHSFKAKYYRQFDFDWSWPNNALTINHKIEKNGYVIKGKIKLAYLDSLDLIRNDNLHIGLFRADYYDKEDNTKVHWYTWKDPKTSSPDFHVPSAFEAFPIRY